MPTVIPVIRSRTFRRSIVLAVALACAAGVSSSGAATRRPPATDSDNATNGGYGWFEAGHTWRGEFADPFVLLEGGTYRAYSSGAGGRYLGVLSSHDFKHWTIHKRWSTHKAPWMGGPDPRHDPSIPTAIRESNQSAGDMWNLNDALVRPTRWGVQTNTTSWIHRNYWATGVAHIKKRWYAYAAVQVSDRFGDGSEDPDGFGRYCLTVARAKSSIGPFKDITGDRPLYCDSDPGGSIDPSPYVDPKTGHTWLTWKASGARAKGGVPGYPSALKAARLDSRGRISGPIHTLLKTREGSWEGSTIENPSMVQWHGRWWLFYSGNWFGVDRAGHSPYATGYALCAGPAGPCNRVVSGPLMKSNSHESGPGGASAFVDRSKRLHLAYASYWPGEYRANAAIHQPRRMHVVTVKWHAGNRLSVSGRP